MECECLMFMLCNSSGKNNRKIVSDNVCYKYSLFDIGTKIYHEESFIKYDPMIIDVISFHGHIYHLGMGCLLRCYDNF